jgi:hypothetical protein
MFGRVRECTREVSKVLLATGAVVTGSSWHRDSLPTTWGGAGVAELMGRARRTAGGAPRAAHRGRGSRLPLGSPL